MSINVKSGAHICKLHTDISSSLFRRDHLLYLQCRRSIALSIFKLLNICQRSRNKVTKESTIFLIYAHTYIYIHIYTHISISISINTHLKDTFMNKLKRSFKNERIRSGQKCQ